VIVYILPSVDAIRFGLAVRALRRRQGLRQLDVAARAGISSSAISRIERGVIGGIAYRTLHHVTSSLEADLQLIVRWHGEGLDRLLDESHAATVEAVVGRLHAAGWECAVEATFAVAGERGSIDVLGRHAATGYVAIVEVKSVIPDVQAMLSSLDRKVRIAPLIARERGWACMGVAKLLYVAEARTARRRVEQHRAIFAAAFPTPTRGAVTWLRDPRDNPPSALLFITFPKRHGSSNSRQVGVRQRVVRPRTVLGCAVERGAPSGGPHVAGNFPPGENLPGAR
jgi:transcriptional regulator with XRE-family HTH domain